MAEPLVRLTRVTRVFGRDAARVTALHAFDGDVRENARIALVGPSGIGKSTLLALVAGLDAPSSGVVERPGLADFVPLRPAGIALAQQTPGLLPAMTVRENVMLAALLVGDSVSTAEHRTTDALARFAIAALAERLPAEISSGQASRVALARATAARPRLLIADEPTGTLDRAAADAALAALMTWCDDEGTALLVATHDPHVAGRFSTTWRLGW
ncbi:MAG: ATP-binding cassette domain-containing protein [Vulcanimicrobiaceae bacterium]